MWTFSIKSILFLTATVAVATFLIITIGFVFAIIVGFAICGFVFSTRFKRRLPRVLLQVAAVTALWFSVVDRSTSYRYCTICDMYSYRTKISLFGYQISSYDDFGNNLLARVAEDLGRPCSHVFREATLRHRFGFLYQVDLHQGILRLADERQYDEELRRKVASALRSDPNFGEIFYERALIKHDVEFLQDFFRRDTVEAPSDEWTVPQL